MIQSINPSSTLLSAAAAVPTWLRNLESSIQKRLGASTAMIWKKPFGKAEFSEIDDSYYDVANN